MSKKIKKGRKRGKRYCSLGMKLSIHELLRVVQANLLLLWDTISVEYEELGIDDDEESDIDHHDSETEEALNEIEISMEMLLNAHDRLDKPWHENIDVWPVISMKEVEEQYDEVNRIWHCFHRKIRSVMIVEKMAERIEKERGRPVMGAEGEADLNEEELARINAALFSKDPSSHWRE